MTIKDLIGLSILHENYGIGKIIQTNDKEKDNVHIEYNSDHSKKFYTFPDDFVDDATIKILDETQDLLELIKLSKDKKDGKIITNCINGINKDGIHDYSRTKHNPSNPKEVKELLKSMCFGTNAHDIYKGFCSNDSFKWDINKAGKFGQQQNLYDKNCTLEGYSVWFASYSSYNERMKNGKGIYNNINLDKSVTEYWNQDDEFDHSNFEEEYIVLFLKNKSGQYEFWGLMNVDQIDNDNKTVHLKYLDDKYKPKIN